MFLMSRPGLFVCLSCALIAAALVRVTTGFFAGRKVIIDIRLNNGNATAGRVEVRVNERLGKVWGTVCDDGWDDKEASVTCRELGLSGGKVLENSVYGGGYGPIYVDTTFCKGNENSLGECYYTANTDCSHSEDVAVACQQA